MIVRVLLCALLAPLAFGQKLLWQRDGVRDQYRFFRAPVVGDLNGDGWEDVATFVDLPMFPGYAELWFLSGRDGTTLRRRSQYAPGWSYRVLARAGDVNGDGVQDYAFTAYNVYANYESVVEVANGLDDTRLWRIGPLLGSTLGSTLLGELDVDRDGRPDLVCVHLSQAPPGVNAALFVGLSNTDWNGVPLPLDLAFANLPGCALHTSVDAFALRTTGSSGLDRGYAFADLPFDLSMTGVRVYAQWLLFGPGNTWPGGLTRPLSWRLAL